MAIREEVRRTLRETHLLRLGRGEKDRVKEKREREKGEIMGYTTSLQLGINAIGSGGDSVMQLGIPSLTIGSLGVTSLDLSLAAGEVIDLTSILNKTSTGQPLVKLIAIKGTGDFDVSTNVSSLNVDIYTGLLSQSFVKVLAAAGTAITHLKISAGLTPIEVKCLIAHG